MSFNLHGYTITIFKAYYTRIIFKNRKAPAGIKLPCNSCNISFEEAVNLFPIKLYYAFKGFVKTVLRPSLPKGLEFNICWISTLLLKVFLNSLHLFKV